jgi:chorismate mutase
MVRAQMGLYLVILCLYVCLSNVKCFVFSKVSTPHTFIQANDGAALDLLTTDVFSLESIRETLIRQEETIIFALIERAQFRRNPAIYDQSSYSASSIYSSGTLLDDQGDRVSLLQWMLTETEKLHAKIRKYTSPEEHAFFPDTLPDPILPALNFPALITAESKRVSDVNPEILRWYQDRILQRMCVDGDDEQYGSSAMCDMACLQALSRRIHYGKFVAESKYQHNPARYQELVEKEDIKGIIELLTNIEVEKKVIRRAYTKASTYGQDIGVQGPIVESTGYKVDPKLIADIYRDMIIPLTKDVEVRYLYNRCGFVAPSADSYLDLCRGPDVL